MEGFKSILVDIDAAAPEHPALARAARLALASGARLTVADVLAVPASARGYLHGETDEDAIVSQRERLARIAEGVSGVSAQARLLYGRPGTALVEEVTRAGHDLLVRAHGRSDESGDPRPFGAVDMELLRRCPCSVLLVRPGRADAPPRVAGAVNASTVEPSARALNERIVEATLLLAELEQGTPMLLQAWTPFAERIVRGRSADPAFANSVEDVRQRIERDFAELVRSFGDRLVGVSTVQRRGQPDAVIADLVVTLGLDVVVMGTVARGGVAGLLLGNTAERVLGRLSCSVLAVKPDGFVSPAAAE